NRSSTWVSWRTTSSPPSASTATAKGSRTRPGGRRAWTPACCAGPACAGAAAKTRRARQLHEQAGGQQRSEQDGAVFRTEQRRARPFGVGHEADHVASVVGDTGDGIQRTIRVVDVAQNDPILVL